MSKSKNNEFLAELNNLATLPLLILSKLSSKNPKVSKGQLKLAIKNLNRLKSLPKKYRLKG